MPTPAARSIGTRKENAPQVFEALGEYQNRQDWRSNWRTTALLRCSDQALYFAGPAMQRLVAVAADSGKPLWSHPYSNYQLILQGDSLYGISGQIDNEVSRRFNPLTGRDSRPNSRSTAAPAPVPPPRVTPSSSAPTKVRCAWTCRKTSRNWCRRCAPTATTA